MELYDLSSLIQQVTKLAETFAALETSDLGLFMYWECILKYRVSLSSVLPTLQVYQGNVTADTAVKRSCLGER